MFHVLFLTLCFGLAMVKPDPPPIKHGAPPLLVQVSDCCNKDLMRLIDKDVFKECYRADMKPFTCNRAICFAMKKGYASSDGTIDKKALQETLEKDFEDNTVALQASLENCVNGDVSKFGKEDYCELQKIQNCIKFQVIKSCDDWKDRADCIKLKSMVETI